MSFNTNGNQNPDVFVPPARGGPHGLGDPNDFSLRKVEREVSIPKVMKKRAQKVCATEVAAFNACGKEHGLLMPFKCRAENDTMNECITALFQKQSFWDECREIYLKDRAEFRATGLTQKERKLKMLEEFKTRKAAEQTASQ